MADKAKIEFLKKKANDIRVSIIEMLVEAESGHTAGPLGMADIFTALYFEVLKHDPKRPDWPDRDKFILSNGHICPVLYAAMAHAGYFPMGQLKTLRKFGSPLQGHPHREFLPALENSSGPLGSGLSQAVGMALADKIDQGRTLDRYIYCALSDGELDCGNTWEAAMLAAKERLGNLIAIIDRNDIQIDGFTHDIMPLEPLADKWKSWNWRVVQIDGNDMEEILHGFSAAKNLNGKPTVIIAKTVPGKGVPQFENQFEWHGKAPTREEGDKALAELRVMN
ncbi:MAG: transketolase [Candidatus Taylorbacteria bacterium]|nr:transketolase [Candidatus Taylorbacteria bacterium]